MTEEVPDPPATCYGYALYIQPTGLNENAVIPNLSSGGAAAKLNTYCYRVQVIAQSPKNRKSLDYLSIYFWGGPLKQFTLLH